MSNAPPLRGDHPWLVAAMIADPGLSYAQRAGILRDVLNRPDPEQSRVVRKVLDILAGKGPDRETEQKRALLEAMLEELKAGPLRVANFVDWLPSQGDPVTRAVVVLDDGVEGCVALPEPQPFRELRPGDPVLVDGRGRVLLFRAPYPLRRGEVAVLERAADERHVVVSVRGDAERGVFLAPADLMEAIRAGRVRPGDSLIVQERRRLVLAALPPAEGTGRYRFLDRGPVPRVIAEQHIGAPPACIEEVAEHVWAEMTRPEQRRRYRLRRCLMKLLCGASGTGKSLAVDAIHRRIYEIMSRVTGTPLEQLPPRVFRVRASDVLSMWLGESEKNWDRLMNEAEALADEPYRTPDGREFTLPVLMILEEVDGLGRARGHTHEAVYDRILTTVLHRLDPHRQLAQRLIIVLATTNVPDLLDVAMARRLAGSVEVFSRLNRRAFVAVLDKLTRDLPVAAANGSPPREVWKSHIQTLAARYFSPNSTEPGLVELTYAGSTTPVVKYRRDFLTGALVERAVQSAAREAEHAEQTGPGPGGITLEQLLRGFEAQFQSLAAQIREHNAADYTDVPDGARVATVRRLPAPFPSAWEFHPVEPQPIHP